MLRPNPLSLTRLRSTKDVFELPFADDDAHVLERRRLTRSAKVAAEKEQPLDRICAWTLALNARALHNKAAVALANKQACRLWVGEHHREHFDLDHVSVHGMPMN